MRLIELSGLIANRPNSGFRFGHRNEISRAGVINRRLWQSLARQSSHRDSTVRFVWTPDRQELPKLRHSDQTTIQFWPKSYGETVNCSYVPPGHSRHTGDSFRASTDD